MLDLILAAVFLGAVQGVSEFLPVSSTAHLVVIPRLAGWRHPLLNSLSFDCALHAGTLLALLLLYGRAWISAFRDLARPRTRKGRFAFGLLAASVPAAVAGLLFENAVGTSLRGSFSVALWLALGAVLLKWADARRIGRRSSPGLSVPEAVIIGCAQAFALLPGLSRSGATITAGLLLGLSRQEAARYSFMLSVPVIAGACLVKGRFILTVPAGEFLPVLAGIAAAGLVGAGAVIWLLRLVSRSNFTPFVTYRLFLAALIALWAFVR